MDMDTALPLSLSFTTGSKKMAFSAAERELIVALVHERPIIEDKRTNAKNIELKKQAWEDLAEAYNSQPYVSQRLTHQLKRCWENIKTQRKKELTQGSMSLKHPGGGVTKKYLNETETRIKRARKNIQHDQELHDLRVQRENILIEREKNLLEHEKDMHALQIQKIKLEIELLNKSIENKTS